MRKIIFIDRIKSCIQKAKAKKRHKLIKKVRTLYFTAYEFYLTLYLIDVEVNKKVDLPAFLYLNGQAVCPQAQRQARESLEENVLKQGIKKINKCYKSYIEPCTVSTHIYNMALRISDFKPEGNNTRVRLARWYFENYFKRGKRCKN